MSTVISDGRADLEERLRGADGPVAVALADVDDFVGVNEAHGRDVGDGVIELLARTLRGSLPDEAIVARIGGDEFACAFPGRTAEDALILMEEIRAHLAAKPHEISGRWIQVRISAGIAALPQHVATPDRLLAAADEALHRAKREGGSRVAIYVEDRMILKSNYYTPGQLDRLSRLSGRLGRTEASLLREAAADLFDKYRDET